MVIQEAYVEYKDNLSEQEIIDDLRMLTNEYLSKQKGFLNRIYYKNKDNIWILLVLFDTKENAMASMANYQSWEKAKMCLEKIKDNKTFFHHYEDVDDLL